MNRLQKHWAEKQFRLVNFILSVPYQPQGERARRPASSRQRPAKREYISKDSGTYILSGKVGVGVVVVGEEMPGGVLALLQNLLLKLS